MTGVQTCALPIWLKAGSLFSVREGEEELEAAVSCLDDALREKGVRVRLLRRSSRGLTLVYLYREGKLGRILEDREVQRFLAGYGYRNFQVEDCLKRLEQRLGQEDFPHDVGVFLDYPLPDIKAFIENRGLNCPCSGYWKAYTNVPAAEKKFRTFKRCTALYCRLVEQGRELPALTRNS